MTLTLGNDLTGLVSREVAASGNKASGLGVSLTTGNDVFVEVVDEFLGNSLRDGEILLGAIAKNTTYGINLLTVTYEYLKTKYSNSNADRYMCGKKLKEDINPYPMELYFLNNKHLIFNNENN